ncbi:MAG: segregation/condensation protein A [Gemmatimonadota bacterium]|nr:segregation/condensation protein A [Gemmatimonadota bacterium]
MTVAIPEAEPHLGRLRAGRSDDVRGGFIVELPEFSGPLDLLLSLIRDEQVDIYDIPIARIAEQFLARIHGMQIDDAAEYLEMAARLLRIKAQMLLPRPEGLEAWEDPRAELVRRLLEYQQVREVVDVLERLADDRRNRFARTYVQMPTEAADRDDRPFAATLADLFAAVDRVLRQATRPIIHDVIPRALDVDGAMRSIREIMSHRRRARWGDIVARDAEPWQILSALLAILELARSGELRIVQRKPFASMELSGDTVS